MTARRYALVAAIVAWFAVLLQCFLSLRLSLRGGGSIAAGLVTFLSFFTVTTNILVCLALTLTLASRGSASGRWLAGRFAIAGIATSIAFVALAYHFLLRNVWHPQGLQWLADVLLHYAIPVTFIGYWFFFARNGSLRWIDPLYWSMYPTLYFVYVLVRGEFVDAYPYGFIDVAAIGYRRSLINAVALLLGFIVLGSALVGIDRTVKQESL